ncbi:MAG: class B sortase [Coriobacteriaceae bacterium]|jgi:sortase B|nr:class B sortase [Coriobacteriaceae bacterium]
MGDYQKYPAPSGRHTGSKGSPSRDSARDASKAQKGTHAPAAKAEGRHGSSAAFPQNLVPAAAHDGSAPSNGQAAYYGYQGSKKRNRGKKSPLSRIVFWVSLLIFVVSLAVLIIIGLSYCQGQNTYKSIAAEIGFTPPPDIQNKALADLQVDWEALREKNPETVAWIYIPGTVVNYPIVQATDNQKYLTTDFLGGQGMVTTFGTPFLAAENSPTFSDTNNILYGHHMNDGSMFACIDDFRDSALFNSHRTIYILTPRGNYRCNSFSLVICGANDPLAQPNFQNAEKLLEYVQDKMARNVVTPDPDDVAAASVYKIFTLVTCDYTINDGRAVLFASVVESTMITDVNNPDEEKAVNPDDIGNVGNAAEGIQ